MCQQFCKSFTCINSFNSYNIFIKYITILPILQKRKLRQKSHRYLVPSEDSNKDNMPPAFLFLNIILYNMQWLAHIEFLKYLKVVRYHTVFFKTLLIVSLTNFQCLSRTDLICLSSVKLFTFGSKTHT